MTRTVLRLRPHEVWSALDAIDPVAVLAEDLIGRTVGRSERTRPAAGRLVSWRDWGPGGGQYVLLEHPETTQPCAMPAHSLRTSLGATLAAVAARELLLSGGVTVALLCTAETAEPQLAVISRYVPDISHVALCLAGGGRTVAPELAALLTLSGIGLSMVRTLADAVFGANLVILTNHGTITQDVDIPRRGRLARGTVLVNATGADLPAALIDQVGQVFIDDFGLLDHHLDRRVVADHLAPSTDQAGGSGRRIAADLGQLLTGRRAGRRRADEVVLVELLGVSGLNVELARRIHEGATRTGLGERIPD